MISTPLNNVYTALNKLIILHNDYSNNITEQVRPGWVIKSCHAT